MAGIWNRIIPAGEGGDRVPVHVLEALMYLSVTGVINDTQLMSALNNVIRSPLDAQAIADLSAVRSSSNAAANVAAKLHILRLFDSLNTAVEAGALTNEAAYRSALGI